MATELAKLAQELAILARTRVAVGVLGTRAAEEHRGTDHDSETAIGEQPTVADVAHWNHYGTAHIPARPFIALALENRKVELQALFARVGRGVMAGKLDGKQALGLMGVEVTNAIVQQIADGVPPPNTEETIDRKGSSTPLINTGQLRQSVSYELRDKSS